MQPLFLFRFLFLFLFLFIVGMLVGIICLWAAVEDIFRNGS
jgi:hypothetical protein